ncbi:MAG: uL30 family ribosomal protein [Nitrososphaerota archaeon]
MASSLIVLNVRGTIDAPHQVRATLRLLNIPKRHMATIIPDSPAYRGMLRVVKDYVAWCPADASTIL